MSEHTPGPWFLINECCVGGPIEPGWEAAGCGIAHCGMRARTQEEAAANARLIAAAPEMFEALKRWVDLAETAIRKIGIEPHPDERTCLVIAKAALAKASPDTAVSKDGGEG
jgi:hypothetical protein